MKAVNKEEGFSLMEIMLALVIISTVMMIITNVNINAFRNWNYSYNKIDLVQQGRVISYFLERDIRKAIDVIVQDGELWINQGPVDSPVYDTYLKYYISSKKLMRKKVKENPAGFIVKYPDWPDSDDWSLYFTARAVTIDIIRSSQFTETAHNTIRYNFELTNSGQQYTVVNEIYPRILNDTGGS
jgi:prepilin-type N-terminal cleavage/methylation domain-containing protein